MPVHKKHFVKENGREGFIFSKALIACLVQERSSLSLNLTPDVGTMRCQHPVMCCLQYAPMLINIALYSCV